jgi:hypothetical protein
MPTTITTSLARQTEFARLREQLAQIGWISEGYVQDRGPGAGGSCYPWTRKVKGKTVCVALSQEQYVVAHGKLTGFAHAKLTTGGD